MYVGHGAACLEKTMTMKKSEKKMNEQVPKTKGSFSAEFACRRPLACGKGNPPLSILLEML